MSAATRRPQSLRWKAEWVGWIAVLAILVAVGYAAFRAYVLGVVSGSEDLILVAILAGVASFFSPCAFPLLPGYLSYAYLAPESREMNSAEGWQVTKVGIAAAAGVSTFAIMLGLVIAVLGAGVTQGLGIAGPDPSQLTPFVRSIVAVGLIVFGLGQLLGWDLRPSILERAIHRARPRRDMAATTLGMYLYGFGYTAAGMGCAGPILSGLMLTALGSAAFSQALLAFVVFAATMAGLMIVVSFLIASSKRTLVRRLQASTARIKTVSGVLLVLVGSVNLSAVLDRQLFVRVLFP